MDILVVNGSTMGELREIVAGRVPQGSGRGAYLYRNREGTQIRGRHRAVGFDVPILGHRCQCSGLRQRR